MKRAANKGIIRGFQVAIVTVAACLLLIPAGVYAHGGNDSSSVPCTVTSLRFRIVTADDDLRGGADNLNILIYFAKGGKPKTASNVNRGHQWNNGSINIVDVALDRPVLLGELRAFRLLHVPDKVFFTIDVGQLLFNPYAGFNTIGDAVAAAFQSPDKWNMANLDVYALANGVSAPVATYGYHSFVPGDPDLTVFAKIPANSCAMEERYGRLNPAAKSVQKISGAGSRYGKEQRTSAIQQPAKPTPQQLQNNRLIQQALAHTVQIGPRASVPGGGGSYPNIIAMIKRQSAASRSLLVPAVRPASPNRTLTGGSDAANGTGTLLNPGTTRGLNPQPLPPKGSGTNQTPLNPGTAAGLNPQPYPPKGSQPQIGASQTMSAPGNASPTTTAASSNPSGNTTNFNLAPQSNSLTPTNGPTAHRPPAGRQPLPLGTRATAPITTICRSGIATVDGGANGVWFSPVAGEDGRFVIQGCGFGNAPGEVYLSGVQFDPAHAKLIVQHLGAPNSPDRVYFQTAANQWSDRQLVVQIDPNASGLYDTNNVTLNVKTAGGQIYQAPGMNFLAARADQLLSWIVPAQAGYSGFATQTSFVSSPTAAIHLAEAMDSSGSQMVAWFESPSGSTTWQNETVDVIRAKLGESTPSKITFPGGTDTYELSLAPGFQLDPQNGVRMNHTQIDVAQCQASYNGEYTANGNWAISYSSEKSFQIFWQEQGCWPKAGTQGVSPMDYGSVSAYALQITVFGPRGVSPWATGNANPLVIKQMQDVMPLKKP